MSAPMKNRIDFLIERVEKQNPSANVKKIRAAYECAAQAHEGQKRRNGEPYIIHPVAVAEIIVEMGLDTDSICAGLLHDCIEDTEFGYREIENKFGTSVAELVDGVTRLGMLRYSKEQEQFEDLRKMFMAMAKDIRVILIKLADRLHNARTFQYLPERKQRDKALETMEIYAPIAHRLGMSRIKWELEDLCLRILDPIGYQEIVDGLEQQSERYEDFLDHIKESISLKLNEAGIRHDISARVKHIYSIYRKMYSQHKTMNEIYDICAVRVIVDTVADCYNVLGYVHDLYKPIPGRFKDYISTPKPNGYQSLHTTVIGRDGIPFEIQIRTEEMHKMAEYGVAAHWKYKQGLDKVGNEQAFSWIRQLLEAQQDTEAEDFIKAIKVDLFADEVFVFTPKGDVVNMPAGATPIDLAYAIHSAVGNRMTGAKVNGRIAPIDSQLKNGDIVEILTSKEAHGPSRDWLKIVRTTEARNKIKQWFKKECREENIIKGKEDLDRELRANLLYNGFYENEEVIQNTLNKFSYQTIDEMYAALGYGGITLTKVLNKVKDEVGRVRRAAERLEKAEQMANQTQQQPQKKNKHSDSGVIVEGIDNCLIKFARCCTPIPGDDIIGFITRGYGVSIHRRDCVNVRINEEDKDRSRWVNCWWDEDLLERNNKFSTALQISTRSRTGVLADIAVLLAQAKVNVRDLNARDLEDGYGVINAVIDVSGVRQLKHIMTRIKNTKGVVDVARIASDTGR
ncbi:GTP pyrophosphokinase [Butyricicoccus pullicaecorum DSM 23266]|uniref:GTP diphosphokinase n=3 Tax=Butyricicoccus pullicaecorum TaxID=501571 RepID=R8W2E9_9FIRM|nr:RelA/SpoT family protein [Butyricicoccus pullicaecorum 1.2]OUP54557.1 (p)ppGpp synthetase [Butyricicoccus pullicaecorum]SKA59016.1 GTP pyrophosphokinase [Butyricicoccus pullicaecorum DSM 23266]